jgi:predicted lipoprotein with Yx(FWY)xxD motif
VYLTGAILPAERVVVVRHLAGCADCRAELAGLAGLPALLRRPPVRAAAQEPTADDTAPDTTGPDTTVPNYTVLDDAGASESGSVGGPGFGSAGTRGSGSPGPGRLVRRILRRRRRRRWLLVTAAFVLVAGGAAGWVLHLAGPPGNGPQAEATVLQARTIGGVTVLTNDEGYTLYWFGPDTASKSACQGSCARTWPPVSGPASWGPGVTGTIGAIVRPGGALQATYDGHPLYTTTADTGPGQTKGNDVWSHGGEWHEVTVPARGS